MPTISVSDVSLPQQPIPFANVATPDYFAFGGQHPEAGRVLLKISGNSAVDIDDKEIVGSIDPTTNVYLVDLDGTYTSTLR